MTKWNTITMRKLFYSIAMFIAPFLAYSQMSQIHSINGDEFCCGYSEESAAFIELIEDPPMTLPSNATFTYVWTVRHENGTTWTWYGSVRNRTVFTPWPGEYTIRVKILYVRTYQNTPFAAFWSQPITIYAQNCSEDEDANHGGE